MRTLIALIIGMTVGSGITTAWQQGHRLLADQQTRDAVTRFKQGIVQGHRLRDRSSLATLYSEDYTAIDARGRLRTKQDLLQALPTDPEMVAGNYDLTSVRRWGSLAVASGHGRMVYRNADGSTRVSEYDSVNVFEERDGRWWYVAAFLP